MKFDFTNTIIQLEGLKVEYGVIYGNDIVVIIKAGAGGSYRGYEDKYLKMADTLHAYRGCTVICLSNYSDDSFERADIDVIQDVVSNVNGKTKMYFIGASNGAVQGLIDATKRFEFVRILLINMPLMLNFHKIKEALTRVNADIQLLYGEKDPSYSYIPFLQNSAKNDTCAARVEFVTIPQADHDFTGMLGILLDFGKNVLED